MMTPSKLAIDNAFQEQDLSVLVLQNRGPMRTHNRFQDDTIYA